MEVVSLLNHFALEILKLLQVKGTPPAQKGVRWCLFQLPELSQWWKCCFMKAVAMYLQRMTTTDCLPTK